MSGPFDGARGLGRKVAFVVWCVAGGRGRARHFGLYAAGDERGVVLDPTEQGRPARVLPGEAEEVQAGDVGDTAPVAQPVIGITQVEVDPVVVGPVSRRPDHPVDRELTAVGEADRSTGGADRA